MDQKTGIVDRINQLLCGREKYPWALSIGLGKGTIDGITRTGSTPGGETLTAIRRCENARADWLLDGRGAPYDVALYLSDETAHEVLDLHLGAEQWNVVIATDGARMALVLHQPGSFDAKDGKEDDGAQRWRRIDYTVIEVIAGRMGVQVLERVRAETAKKRVRFKLLPAAAMTQIENGQVGTYRLLQAPDALLADAEPIDARHAVFNLFSQQELFPATSDEAALLGHYRAMKPENRHAVNQVASAMAEYSNQAEHRQHGGGKKRKLN